ncbi:MAG TPA: hypothetical protein VFE58_05095 [Tepidisphaeraceae bacterium]|nr:hypothetical protein [Tepidisphaeraceae bacterium]
MLVYVVESSFTFKIACMAEYETGWRGIIRDGETRGLNDHLNPVFIKGAEEKAAESRGQKLVGKITLSQVEILSSNGLGDEICKWTAHHAKTIIDKYSLIFRPTIPQSNTSSKKPCVACPQCGDPVRIDRLSGHLRKIHNTILPA